MEENAKDGVQTKKKTTPWAKSCGYKDRDVEAAVDVRLHKATSEAVSILASAAEPCVAMLPMLC